MLSKIGSLDRPFTASVTASVTSSLISVSTVRQFNFICQTLIQSNMGCFSFSCVLGRTVVFGLCPKKPIKPKKT